MSFSLLTVYKPTLRAHPHLWTHSRPYKALRLSLSSYPWLWIKGVIYMWNVTNPFQMPLFRQCQWGATLDVVVRVQVTAAWIIAWQSWSSTKQGIVDLHNAKKRKLVEGVGGKEMYSKENEGSSKKEERNTGRRTPESHVVCLGKKTPKIRIFIPTISIRMASSSKVI